MKKEAYIKPEIKSEILNAEVLNQNWGSGGNNNSGNNWGCNPRPRTCWWWHW